MKKYLVFLLLFLSVLAYGQKNKKPNVVYILTDQQSGNAMSCVGNTMLRTPAIDQLASDGVLFTQAYCTFPICTPARASMMTGRMPHQTGNMGNSTGIQDSLKQKSLGFTLQRNGYDTFYGGKWHLPSYTMRDGEGFETIANFGDDDLAQSAADYINQEHSKPFFMMVSFDDPHNICEFARNQPMPWGEVDIPKDPRQWPNLPPNFAVPAFEPDIIMNYKEERPSVFPTFTYTPDDWRKYRYVYNRLVERVDAEIQKVIQALKESGQYDNTLIIFSSDHGDGQGAHQWNQKTILYNESIHVPFIVKLPGSKNSGERISVPVSAGLDLFPTIASVTNTPAPDGLEGHDLSALMGTKEPSRPPVFVETVLEVPDVKYKRYYHGYAVLMGKYKYINYSQSKYREQLFDLEADPGEMVNLAVEAKYDDQLKGFRALLVNWMTETNAPGIRRYKYNPDVQKVAPHLFK